MNITNDDFNYFRMKGNYNLRRLREYGLINPRPTSTTSSYKRHSTFNNPKRYIKYNPDTLKFEMVTPLCNDNKFITSVNNENNFITPDHGIMVKKNQDRKEGLEKYRISPSDEPNPMGYRSNTLLSSNERKSKAFNPDHTKNISLITLEKIILVPHE